MAQLLLVAIIWCALHQLVGQEEIRWGPRRAAGKKEGGGGVFILAQVLVGAASRMGWRSVVAGGLQLGLWGRGLFGPAPPPLVLPAGRRRCCQGHCSTKEPKQALLWLATVDRKPAIHPSQCRVSCRRCLVSLVLFACVRVVCVCVVLWAASQARPGRSPTCGSGPVARAPQVDATPPPGCPRGWLLAHCNVLAMGHQVRRCLCAVSV
jgi:hypothetical protein